jgi:chromosome segregation ATPase
MCLGLGGEPRHLGRADDAREFITHGKDKALVEIEVAPHEGKEGHIFRRVIDRNKGSENGRGKGSSTFFVNGEQTNIKEIRNIVGQVYNISIDNLCTFLPQDRVGSFSGFNSKQLLEETEKSLSGSQHLFETHQTLIKLEAEFLTGDNNVDAIRKRLKASEADFANMEREKQRMQERQDALESIDLLEKKIIWLKYDEIRSRCIELKGEKDAARKALDAARLTVAPMEEQAAQLQHKVQQISSRLQTLDNVSQQASAEMKKQVKKYENHSSDMDEIVCQLGTIDEGKRIAIRELEKCQDMLAAEEAKLNALPQEEDLRLQMEEEANVVRSLAQPFRDLKREQGRINQELREAEHAVNATQTVLNKMNDVKQNRRNKVFQQFTNLKQISDFVNDNRKEFRRPVWGPIACEVEIKSNNAAAYLEQHVPNHVFKSFVVECSEDYNLLYQRVRVEMNLPINILTVKDGKLAPVERVYSDAKMKVLNQEHGVIGYLDQYVSERPHQNYINAPSHLFLVQSLHGPRSNYASSPQRGSCP